MCVYTNDYMHAITISVKEAMNLKERKERFMGGDRGMKRKGEM